MKLPLSRGNFDIIASWLAAKTGIEARYFGTKITNKFPGLSNDWLSSVSGVWGVSGTFHFYLETADIRHETEWYGDLSEIHNGQQILVTDLYPFEFQGSRYYQYGGSVSGVVSGF